MYLLCEESYSETNWYKRILSPMKAEARRKRLQLFEETDPSRLPPEETCAFLLGGSEEWILETVRILWEAGKHPILLGDVDDSRLPCHVSRVRSDYGALVARLGAQSARLAFYGMNPASASDLSRRQAFLSSAPTGEIFENRGSLCDCFDAFLQRHRKAPFDAVLCANDLAAVSLRTRLDSIGEAGRVRIAAQSTGAILSYFPDVETLEVDPAALSRAAFEIADCMKSHPDFIGISIAVDFLGAEASAPVSAAARTDACASCSADPFYADPEMRELLHVEHLLSSLDETDRKILRLISDGCTDIGEEAFLSDNGVKYRIKKMKKLCGVESKREIPALLGKYGIEI